MVIYGKPIAQKIYQKIIPHLRKLQEKKIKPTLMIILIGNNPRSIAYVTHKLEKGKKIGLNVFVDKRNEEITEEQLITLIKNYNHDPKINGIVVQLPLLNNLDQEKIIKTITRSKDVDGFLVDSPFTSPIAKATIAILQEVHRLEEKGQLFTNWLRKKQIVVIGRGITGGKPIYQYLIGLKNNVTQINSQTKNPNLIIKKADIIISCIGKKGIITKKNIKKGVILISTGLHLEKGKLKGDYEEEEIKSLASFYTPTPEGIGPVNVACLLENVIQACEKENE